MAIYNEILIWSETKPLFLRDALRRIIEGYSLTLNDINELTLLLKKENGMSSIELVARPLDISHIPAIAVNLNNSVKLINISKPINICLFEVGLILRHLNQFINQVQTCFREKISDLR